VLKLLLFALALLLLPLGSPSAEGAGRLDLEDLVSVPEGNYLVTLELNGKQVQLNLKVQNDRAKCVNSSVPAYKDLKGQFTSMGKGNFAGRFSGSGFAGTQHWIFRRDGSAAIREVPDRGEQQGAVPVPDDSLEPPKKK
jgi:hypothetical protein